MTTAEFRYKLVNLQDPLRRFALSLTSDQRSAMDLVQETFLKALNNREKFTTDISLKAWTFTIMKNTFINEYRRCKRQNISHERNDESSFFNNTKFISIDDPSSVYFASELVNNIEQLQEAFRAPLQLLIKGYKYQEIAEELDLNIGTVKSRIFLSRKHLSNLMNR